MRRLPVGHLVDLVASGTPTARILASAAMLLSLSLVLWVNPIVGADIAAQQAGPDPETISIELIPVPGGLQRAVGVANAGDRSGRLFVIEKAGRVRIYQDGELLQQPFLDIVNRVNSRGNEQGLLGLAFHPDYAENGHFYVNYTTGSGSGQTVITRFTVEEDPNLADAASEVEVLTFDQPHSNHNGGHLVFGPDGYLYVGIGDGGSGGDPSNFAQNGRSLLGKMLRLDVDGVDEGYAVPADNPFIEDPRTLDEIWATGLRNPWRYDFDPATGDLYIGDVGQGTWEEINLQAADSSGGENYGWRIMEGNHCFNPPSGCNRTGLVPPVAEYSHQQGDRSVTGGLVYRGAMWPEMAGLYIYADYVSGRFWGLSRDTDGEWRNAQIGRFSMRPSSFGYGEDGEIYVSADGSGPASLYRLVQAGATPAPTATAGPTAAVTPDEPDPSPTTDPSATTDPSPTTEPTMTSELTPEATETPGPGTPDLGDQWRIFLPYLLKDA